MLARERDARGVQGLMREGEEEKTKAARCPRIVYGQTVNEGEEDCLAVC